MLFAGTFCISLFVVMMQFLWKYVDELVGKGLSLDVLGKFFFYAGETLVPLALPLGVLLASLISFGNMGEKFELLAIKASGVSLFRTLRPLIVLNAIIAVVSFYFQNNIAPKAEENLLTLRWSILQTSPEVDIPEGVFYSGIPGLNMYIKQKDKGSGILHDVMIYNLQDGVNNAHIIIADSGKLETSAKKSEMILTLWNGEQFENISNSGLQTRYVPYRRETFVNKRFIIDFDQNFTMEENEGIGRSATTKRMDQIVGSIDSMKVMGDSLAAAYYNDMAVRALYVNNTTRQKVYSQNPVEPVVEIRDTTAVDSQKVTAKDKVTKKDSKPRMVSIPKLVQTDKEVKVDHKLKLNLDTLFEKLDNPKKLNVINNAMQRANIVSMSMDYNVAYMQECDGQIRRHWVQYWQKITMALACLLFFFIGAPLGAIIRKGGLGMPVVIAVVIFLIYYIINTGGMRAGREGSIPVWIGMWLSTAILTPIAVFFTVKSNNDSMVFNKDAYSKFFRKLMGVREKRHIVRKEVIINDPDYVETLALVEQLILDAKVYRQKIRRPSLVRYIKYLLVHFFTRKRDEQAEALSKLLEHIVDILSNSKDKDVLNLLSALPIIDTHTFRFYRRRRGDIRAILDYGGQLKKRINVIVYGSNQIQ